MLQAYQARKNSENAFASLDEEITKFQEENLSATSYSFSLHSLRSRDTLISIAKHFSYFGYDFKCTTSGSFTVDWSSAEEGRNGTIYINNNFCYFTQDAIYV